MTSVRLPEDIEYRLNALSVETHRTKSFYIIEALRNFLENVEDLHIVRTRDSDSEDDFYTHDEILAKLKHKRHA